MPACRRRAVLCVYSLSRLARSPDRRRRRMATSENTFEAPRGLKQVVVGDATAREIKWGDSTR